MSCTISKALRAGVFPQVTMCIGAGSRENCYSFLLNPSLPKNQFQLLRSLENLIFFAFLFSVDGLFSLLQNINQENICINTSCEC